MNSRGIRIIRNTVALLSCSITLADVGEFMLSEKLLNQIEVQSTQTEPFFKKGRRIEPNINIRVTPQLGNSDKGGKINLNVNLNGTSRAHSSTQVTRRRSVQAVVESQVNANFQQELTFTADGLKQGRVTGGSQIDVNNISINNNFRLLNGVVNRKALQQAPGQIAAEMPTEKADLAKQISSEMQRGTNDAKNIFDSALANLAPIISDQERFPFDSSLSTKTGNNGQIRFEISDIEKGKQTHSKPNFDHSDQLMASGTIHQDLLTKIMTSELAGKELRFSQVQKILCGPKMRSFIDLCKTAVPPEAEGLSLVFDESKPIEFFFEDGRVAMRLNASYRTGVPRTNEDDQALLNSPGETKPQFETIPYQVEVKYKIEDGGAKLEKLSVKEKNAPALSGLSALSGLFGGKDHSNNSKDSSRPTAGTLLNPIVKTKIHDEFKNLLAEEIDFHSASIPTKVKITKGPHGTETEILEAGSLLPIEVKSERGWLAVGNTFCNDANRALGVGFTNSKGTLKDVDKGSPAELTGFKSGDTIQTFSEPGGRSTAFGKEPDSFIKFIQDKAANKNSQDRKVVISGITRDGTSFQRTVFLCPTRLNHKQQALKGLAQFKKND